MAIIRITNLRLRAVIGANDWERDIQQDLVINLKLNVDAFAAIASDDLKDTVDYKDLKQRIMKAVESSQFHLIEKVADMLLTLTLENPLVNSATVRVDKPTALRYADSVSVEMTRSRDE